MEPIETAEAGDWVEVYSIVLRPGERAPQVPGDTKALPLEMRQKGFLLASAQVGDEVEIRTVTGRLVKGKLSRVNPRYTHHFGRPAPELMTIGIELRRLLREGGSST